MANEPEHNRPEENQMVAAGSTTPSAVGYGGNYGSSLSMEGQESAGNFVSELAEYWWTIRKHMHLVVATILGCMAMGGVVTLLMTPVYTSVVKLQIDRNAAKVVEGGNINPVEVADTEFLKTQYEILQSRSLAERVVAKLQLGDDPIFMQDNDLFYPVTRFFQAKQTETDRADRVSKAVRKIIDNRIVRPVLGSRLVDLSYSDVSPALAQKITDALANAYIAVTLDKRFDANSYAKTFLDDQLKQLQVKLQDSERAQLEFGEKEQIIATVDKASIAENNLAAANAELGKLTADRIRDEQLFNQSEKSNVTDLRQVLESKVIEDLRTTRNKFLTEYQEKLQLFKPSYPEMVQIDNKIKEIDKRILSEALKIKNSLKASFESSQAQENQMKTQIEKLRTEVLDLQKRSVKYNILKREADVNRSLYDSLLQRYKEVDIAGGVGANNIFIVDKAEVPKKPSSPRVVFNILIATFLGTLLGVVGAFAMEWFNDNVRSVEDLEKVTKLSTLGVIPRVPDGKAIDVELTSMHSVISESYRTLATSLYFATESGLPKSIFITSSGPGEGKSTTSIAIARHFAATGLKVLLVDGDLRKASLHTKLGLGPTSMP